MKSLAESLQTATGGEAVAGKSGVLEGQFGDGVNRRVGARRSDQISGQTPFVFAAAKPRS